MAELRRSREAALVVGAGSGLSAVLLRRLAVEGFVVAAAARNTEKLKGLTEAAGVHVYGCDATQPQQVQRLFRSVRDDLGVPSLVIYNAGARYSRGNIEELDAEAALQTILVGCYGGLLVGQAAARQMLPEGRGTILFTGASASIKGFPRSAPFAMAKFGLRALAQSMARELAPKNIHVGHVIVDGPIADTDNTPPAVRRPDDMMDAHEIAQTYLFLHRQKRSAWSWEVEVRTWLESF